MSATAIRESFRYVCGKCRSAALYRDDDRLVGDFCIACPTCGNRYYNDIGRVSVGVAPVKISIAPSVIPAADEPTGPRSERMANLFTRQTMTKIADVLLLRQIANIMAVKMRDAGYAIGWSRGFMERIRTRRQTRRRAK